MSSEGTLMVEMLHWIIAKLLWICFNNSFPAPLSVYSDYVKDLSIPSEVLSDWQVNNGIGNPKTLLHSSHTIFFPRPFFSVHIFPGTIFPTRLLLKVFEKWMDAGIIPAVNGIKKIKSHKCLRLTSGADRWLTKEPISIRTSKSDIVGLPVF